MENYNEDFLIKAHIHSGMHRTEILKSEDCSCFYCLEIYSAEKIEEWVDEENEIGQTAICPFCGIDSVLGSASNLPITDINFLKQMQTYFF